MRRATLASVVTALLAVAPALALTAAPAGAAGIPDGCTSDALHLSFANDPGSNDVFHVHRVGDQMQIGVVVSNNGAGACSYDDTTVSVQVPNADGTPGPSTAIATNASFPAGMAPTQLSVKAPYTVAFDPAVFRGRVTVSATGTAHFPGGDQTQTSSLSTNVVVSKPHATLTMTASTPSGPAPLGVTDTYTLTNDSPVDPAAPTTTPALIATSPQPTPDASFLSDDTCTPLTYTGGDTHVTSPAEIDPGESWTFTCTHTFADFGTFTSHAAVVGFSGRDGRPWPTTTAQSTVTATAPDLTVALAHAGTFTQGDAGRTYALTVTNAGNATSSAAATVADTLPAGLTATAISGSGWTCTLSPLTCTRPDPLAAGASYPAITVTTDVAPDAPASVTNMATVAGGGELDTADDTASDVTTIAAPTLPAPTAPSVLATTPAPTAATPPLVAPAPRPKQPSNRFVVRRVRVSRSDTVMFSLTAPGPGVFTLLAPKARAVRATARRAGPLTLALKHLPRADVRARRIRVTISFTPTGGAPSVQHRTVTLHRHPR